MYSKVNNFKRVLLLSSLFLMFTFFSTLRAEASHWADKDLDEWDRLGLIKNTDYNYGDFRPDDYITRAEFMSFINRMKGYTYRSPKVNDYWDVKPSDWYYDTVAIALGAGYINGVSADKMSPNHHITREQAMTILTRINKAYANTDSLKNAHDGYMVSHWAKSAVAACISEGYVSGDKGMINPAKYITRAEAVVMLNRVYSDTRVFALAGTYDLSNESINNIEVLAGGIALKNFSLKNDLLVRDTLKGNIEVEDANIKGEFIVKSGDVDLDDVKIKEILRLEGGITLVDGKTEIDKVIIMDSCTFKNRTDSYKEIEEVWIHEDASDELIKLTGDFYRLENDANYPVLRLDGEIDKLVLNDSIKIKGDGEINDVDREARKLRIKRMNKDGEYETLSENTNYFKVDGDDYEDDEDEDDEDDDKDEDYYEKRARKFEKKHRDILEERVSGLTWYDRWEIEEVLEDYDDLKVDVKDEISRDTKRQIRRLKRRLEELKEAMNNSTSKASTSVKTN